VVEEFGGVARFVEVNYGESDLAKRLGVTRYPAIFVDEVLVATPNDFGFFGKGEGESGRYAPLRSAASHERFRADLARMIRLTLAGDRRAARAVARPAADGGPKSWPALTLTDLEGRALAPADLAGRAVLLEFWATWCPPCRATLQWLGQVGRRYGDQVAIVAVAGETDSAQVRKLAPDLGLPLRWVQGRPEIARAFGDVSAVPTLHLFDRDGKAVGSFFGAPPDLHARVEERLSALLTSRN
jgi:thiol-disulfide isomerase/thioredoxin